MTPEAFTSWRKDQTTREVMQYLHDLREALKEQWAAGVPLDDTVQMQAQSYGFLIGLDASTIRQFYAARDEEAAAALADRREEMQEERDEQDEGA